MFFYVRIMCIFVKTKSSIMTGKQAKIERIKRGKTIVQMAKEIEVSPRTLNVFELGRSDSMQVGKINQIVSYYKNNK